MNNYTVLFVCTGNICRSPMAEGIMKELILDEIAASHQVMPLEIISAGTYAIDLIPASSFAIEVATQHGIDLKFHRSRFLTTKIANDVDLILVMEKNHAHYIKQQWPDIDYVYELKKYALKKDAVMDLSGIQDPIGMEYEIYSKVFKELQKEIIRISQLIFSHALEKNREA